MKYQTELIERKDGLDLRLREYKPKKLEVSIDRLEQAVEDLREWLSILVMTSICVGTTLAILLVIRIVFQLW